MRDAPDEGITSEMVGAVALRLMLGHLTQGIDTTRTHTWITALVIDAGQHIRAMRVGDALRAAIRWLVIVAWKALTHWASLN